MQALSFAEIIKGRDSSVRVTEDGMIYAVDLVMVMTGLSRDDSGKTLRRLSDELFQSDKLSERQFSNHGGYKTKLVSFEHALELIMVLPGSMAKATRVQFADILKRYMAGDQSLITEIEANAQSSSPIAQMARGSLGTEHVQDERSLEYKRKREELDFRMAEYEHITRVAASYSELCEGKAMDERARKIFKDNLLSKTMMMPPCNSGSGGSKAELPVLPVNNEKKLSSNAQLSSVNLPDIFRPDNHTGRPYVVLYEPTRDSSDTGESLTEDEILGDYSAILA